jgi:F-type H+-transporting ATPase subunit c
MEIYAIYIHYGTIALTVTANALAVGIGQGITSYGALQAINMQPSARNEIVRASVLGMALMETAALMGTFISFLLLVNTPYSNALAGFAEIGIVFSVGLSGFVLGIVSALPARAACLAIARQPFFSQQIVRFMLIALSLLQTPIIFGLIVALIIRGQAGSIETVRDSLRLISSGVCIGLGSIGPAIGLAFFTQSICKHMGVNRSSYRQLFSFALISQAIIETPILFALIISISLLLMVPSFGPENLTDGVMLLAAGLCTGIGTMGPGISSGKTAMQAGKQIAYNPETYSVLSRTSMFAQGLIETAAIYAVLISFVLLFLR